MSAFPDNDSESLNVPILKVNVYTKIKEILMNLFRSMKLSFDIISSMLEDI